MYMYYSASVSTSLHIHLSYMKLIDVVVRIMRSKTSDRVTQRRVKLIFRIL